MTTPKPLRIDKPTRTQLVSLARAHLLALAKHHAHMSPYTHRDEVLETRNALWWATARDEERAALLDFERRQAAYDDLTQNPTDEKLAGGIVVARNLKEAREVLRRLNIEEPDRGAQ